MVRKAVGLRPGRCARARATLLLFTDADTRHEPELLGRAVGALQHERADLVTVVAAPALRDVLGAGRHAADLAAAGHSAIIRARVNRARRERDVIANGQFILTTREAYEAVGTHAAVRHEVAEDLALAQAYLRHGRRLHFAFAERLMETRMYQSLGAAGRRVVQEHLSGRAALVPRRAGPAGAGAGDAAGRAGVLAASAGGAAARVPGR